MTQNISKYGVIGALRSPLRCLIVMSVFSPLTALAQSSGQSLSIEACQATQDSLLRLRCYDALFARDLPVSKNTIEEERVVPDRSDLVTDSYIDGTEKGDLLRPVEVPKNDRIVEDVKPEKVTSISEPVSKIQTFGYKKLRITLANGQVWEQIGSVTQRAPKISAKRTVMAEIREGVLNSYFLQFDGKGRAIKVRRVN